MFKMLKINVCYLTIAYLLSFNTAFSAPSRYSIKDWGVIKESRDIEFMDMNDNGVIVGRARTIDDSNNIVNSIFRFEEGKSELIKPPEGFELDTYDSGIFISNKNQIAYQTHKKWFDWPTYRIMIREADGTTKPLFDEGSSIIGMNKNGDILGHFFNANASHAVGNFVYKDGKIIEIKVPFINPQSIQPEAINNKDQVVGTVYDKDRKAHGFLWNPNGEVIDFNEILGNESDAVAINNQGDVFVVDWPHYHSYIYTHDGHLNPLSQPLYIQKNFNDQKEFLADRESLYQEDVLYPLHTLLDNLGEWSWFSAYTLNNKGQIAGFGNFRFSNDRSHLFVMSPIQ